MCFIVKLFEERKNMTDKRFCVYIHKDSDGIVRYVGEGTIDRAYTKYRSDQPTWVKVFGENPPTVEIIARDMEKEEAEFLELKVRDFYADTIFNNPYATKRAHPISKDEMLEHVRYDETSPSFLRWNLAMKNNATKDSPAGHVPTKERKYCTVEINGTSYGIHRVIWTILVGEIPKGMFVDHIDGNKKNNNISNLRLVNPKENSHNKISKELPSSGYRAIREYKENGVVKNYMVRWHELDDMKRLSKLFSVSNYGSQEQALKAAYVFRDSLIERGCMSVRVKEGETQID